MKKHWSDEPYPPKEAFDWIAGWLDLLDGHLIEYFRQGRLSLVAQGKDTEGADQLIDMVAGKAVQNDLRKWADNVDKINDLIKAAKQAREVLHLSVDNVGVRRKLEYEQKAANAANILGKALDALEVEDASND